MQRDASTTSGLARLRPLTAGKPEPSNIPKNLPDGWFYNESKEENIWKDLEKYDNVYASSVLEDENKRTQNTSQMGEASNKINKLIEKFEEIDQEVLGEMQKLFDADENDGNGDNDAEQFIQNEKASAVQFIEELNQYSDSQVYLLESLKKSFNAIQGTSSFLSMEASDQEKSPDPKIVIESLEKIFAENIDRAERASTLHHDVTNFWVHHLSSFKKVISKKNEEINASNQKIQKLQQELDSKKLKVKNNTKDEEDKQQKQKQFENALKTIEEQKIQINQLKSQLKQSEQERAAIPIQRDESIPAFVKEEQIKKEAEANNKLLEAEAKVAALTERVNQLDKDLRKSRLQTEEEKGNTSLVQKQLDDANVKIKEMDLNIQKYMNLLEIEKSKHNDGPEITNEQLNKERQVSEAEKEQFLIEIMRLKGEIKEIQENNLKQLNEQTNRLTEKFMREKQSLITSLENSKDNSNLLQSIINEYEKRISDMKEEHDKELERQLRLWGGKLSVQQRQYQSRIKQLNQNHEVELINARKSVEYETAKLKIELENENETKMIEETRKFEQTNKELQEENNKLRNIINDQDTEIKNLQVKYGAQEDEKERPPALPLQYARLDPAEQRKMLEQYAARVQSVKEDLTTQSNWALQQQKEFYERQIENMTELQQKETRNLLLRVQEALSHVTNQGETAITLDEALAQIHNTVSTMNDHAEENAQEKVETVPLKEANERMRVLTDLLTKIKAERDELLSKDGIDHTKDEIDALRARLKYYESLTEGDKESQIKAMKEMEDNFKQEIAVKDALIAHYKEEKQLSSAFFGSKSTCVVYSQEPTSEASVNANKTQNRSPSQQEQTQESSPPTVQEGAKETVVIKERSLPQSASLHLESPCVIMHYRAPEIHSEPPKLVNEIIIKQKSQNTEPEPFFKRVPSKFEIQTNNPITIVKTLDDYSKEESSQLIQQLKQNKSSEQLINKPISLNEQKPLQLSLMKSTPQFELKQLISEQPKNKLETSSTVEHFSIESSENDSMQSKKSTPRIPLKLVLDEIQSIQREEKQESPKSPVVIEREVPIIERPESPPKEPKESTPPIQKEIPVISYESVETMTDFKPKSQKKAQLKMSHSVSLERAVFRLIDITQYYSINTFDVLTLDPKPEEDKWRPPQINYIRDPVFIEQNEGNQNNSGNNSNVNLSIHPNFQHHSNTPQQKEIKAKLSLSDFNYYGIPQRFVTMTQNAAPIIIRYKGQRDMVKFPDFVIEGCRAQLEIVPSDILNELYDIQLNYNIENLPPDPLVEQEKRRIQNEINQKDTTIARQEAHIDDLTSQLKKLQAAYRLAQQNESQLQLLREKNNSMEQLLMKSQERLVTSSQSQRNNEEETSVSKSPSKEEIKKDLQKEETNAIQNDSKNKKITVDTSMIEDNEDPFTKAIQLMAACMRFIGEYKKNQTEISKTIRSDYLAYESFLVATGSMKDAESSFINEMKESSKSLENNIDQLDDFSSLQHQLLSVLRQSKKKAQSLTQESLETAKSQLSQEIERQQKELQNSIQVGQAKADQLVLLGKIRTALETVTSLQLNLNEEDKDNYQKLLRQLNFIELEVKNKDKVFDYSQNIETLKVNTQNLIAGLKPQQDDHNKYINTQNIRENSILKNKIKNLEEEIKQLHQEIDNHKDKYVQLMQQYSQLKDRLQEEKDTNMTTISTYQAQISTLKELLQHTDSSAGTPVDTVSAIKNEFISLHTLVETMRLERDMKQSKIDEMQEQIKDQTEALQTEQKKYDELLQMKEDLEKLVRKQDEQALFHESDMQKLKLERAQNEEIGMKNRLQLEESLGVIDQLNKKIEELQKTISDLRKELQYTKNDLEDLQIKYSFGHYNRTKIPHTTTGTQTMFKLVVHHRKKHKEPETKPVVEQEQQKETPENDQNAENTIETPQITVKQIEESHPLVTTPRDDNNTTQQQNETPEQSKDNKEEEEEEYEYDTEERLPLSDENSATDSSLYHSYEQWVEVTNDEEKDKFADELDVPTQADTINVKDFGNQAVGEVHAPLETKKAKPKISPLLDQKKGNLKRASTAKRPMTSINRIKPDPKNLAIGDFSQLNTQNTTQNKTINQRYRPASRKIIQPPLKQKPPKLEPIQFSIRLSSDRLMPQTTPTSPKTQNYGSKLRPNGTLPMQANTNVTSPLVSKKNISSPEQSLNDTETVRITRIQYEHSQTEENTPRAPLVIPIQRTSWSDKKGQNNEVGDLSEIELIIAKLREKNSRQQEEIDQKDQTISDLNQKVSSLMRDLQRAKLDAIRNEDITKKTTIKYDNIKARLDIAMQELDSRNDETSKMRKEIEKLKRAAIPASQTLSRLKNAQQEQQRIATEQLRKKQMIDQAKSAMERTNNENIYKHIEVLMKNTQKSLNRLEATKRMWKEIENKQLIGALAAMSHLDDSQSNVFFSSKNPFLKTRPLRQKPRVTFEDEDLPKQRQENAVPKLPIPITYDQTLEAIGELGSGVTSEERRQALRGNVSDKIIKHIMQQNEKPKIDGTVLTGSPTQV